MPHLWLRVAVVFYGLGLLYALATLSGRREFFQKVVLAVFAVGTLFHFVSLAEWTVISGHLVPVSIHQSESLFGLLLMITFFIIYARYKTISTGTFVFPLVFLLALFSALGERPAISDSPLLRNGWIMLHIFLILSGYVALFFSFISSLLYLVQEKSLKAKLSNRMFSRLPSLEVIDEIGYRSLLVGFPLMTLGLLVGTVVAQESFGVSYFADPKIWLSVLMWAVYLVLLVARWSTGWRGRRAAVLASVAFAAALGAWAANYFSSVHRYLAP
jgi:ABC-type uncharacterized transport system permease subunit